MNQIEGSNLPDNTQTPAAVGLLFVHGIGTQRKGTQVTRVVSALSHFFEHHQPTPKGQTPLTVQLGSVVLFGDQPARAELIVPPDGTGDATRWLIAEALWSDSFLQPGLLDTLRWLTVRVPPLLTTRALEKLQSIWMRLWHNPWHVWRLPLYASAIIVSAPLSLLLIALIAIAALLRQLIPFTWAQSVIESIVRTLTGVIGDSYLYASAPVNRAAMETAVARDLRWLQQRASKIVVVAHSQGAAVAAGVLEQYGPVDTFVTLGAGIGELSWLQRFRTETFIATNAAWLITLGVVYHAVSNWIVPLVYGDARNLLMAVMFGGVVWLAAPALAGWAAISALRRTLPLATQQRTLSTSRWLDLWASADVIPGGPATAREFQNVTSLRVWNHGNILRDHTSYLTNQVEVVSRIASHMLLHSPEAVRGRSPEMLSEVIPIAAALRRRRGAWLEGLRVAVGFTLVTLGFVAGDEMRALAVRPLEVMALVGVNIPQFLPGTSVSTAYAIGWVAAATLATGVYLLGLGVFTLWATEESLRKVETQRNSEGLGFGWKAGPLLVSAFIGALILCDILLFTSGSLIQLVGGIQAVLTYGLLGLFAASVLSLAGRTNARFPEFVRKSSSDQRLAAVIVATVLSTITASLVLVFDVSTGRSHNVLMLGSALLGPALLVVPCLAWITAHSNGFADRRASRFLYYPPATPEAVRELPVSFPRLVLQIVFFVVQILMLFVPSVTSNEDITISLGIGVLVMTLIGSLLNVAELQFASARLDRFGAWIRWALGSFSVLLAILYFVRLNNHW